MNSRYNLNLYERVDSTLYEQYVYNRTKNIYIDEETNQERIFLLAGLTKILYQPLSHSVRRRVTPIKTKHFDVLLSEAPKYSEMIPLGTISKEITKYEFEKLLSTCDDDPKILFCFAINEKPI